MRTHPNQHWIDRINGWIARLNAPLIQPIDLDHASDACDRAFVLRPIYSILGYAIGEGDKAIDYLPDAIGCKGVPLADYAALLLNNEENLEEMIEELADTYLHMYE